MTKHMSRLAAVAATTCLLTGFGLGGVPVSTPADAMSPSVDASPVLAGPVPGTSRPYRDGDNTFRVYTPRGFSPDQQLPLVVMVHGCNTNPGQQESANLFDPLADRKRFVVLYPNHDQEQTDEVGTHPVRCWRWYSAADQHRGAGDPATIARQTRRVIRGWHIDRRRVYVVGMSSGGMMTSILGATYPDLYAAIGVVAGCGYGGGAPCVTDAYQQLDLTDTEAAAAHREQGDRARVVPILAIQGDRDATVSPRANLRAVQQWLKTANLAVTGHTVGPFPFAPATSGTRRPPRKYPYLVQTWRARDGCLIGKRVLVHGMDHYWPGGSTDPRWYEWEDPRGPNGALLAWRFFQRYRLGRSDNLCGSVERDR